MTVPWQRFLTVEILQLPALMPLLSGEYSATELLSIVNSAIVPPLLFLPCRARMNCQPSTELSQQPTTSLHFTSLRVTSLHFTSLHFSLHFTSLTWTALSRPGVLAICTWLRGGPNRKHCLQQYLYCCYGQLPSDSPDIVDVFTGRYQAAHVPSRDRCLATVHTLQRDRTLIPCFDYIHLLWAPPQMS
jgi:hypothetical protein